MLVLAGVSVIMIGRAFFPQCSANELKVTPAMSAEISDRMWSA